MTKMKKNEMFSYIGDFLSVLYFKKDFLDKINNVILFGSVARKDFDKDSDIDLFIDVKNVGEIKKIEELVDSALNEFEIRAREVWHIRNIKNPIKCVIGALKDEKWRELKKEIQSYGIVLYGSFKSGYENLESHSLFEYSLKDFKQKDRVAFLRKLVGYKSSKKKKTYVHEGMIKKINGLKLENNNIIVPSKEAVVVQKFFTKKKVTPKITEIWVREK
ncbi:nucleotidyltransferase domain-containing protein [Candidatus Woesearchaeota archaeon]|nr:nucleotidyltransferase domain-containing protein [Candidatus Woesearchaeota archaeon]